MSSVFVVDGLEDGSMKADGVTFLNSEVSCSFQRFRGVFG